MRFSFREKADREAVHEGPPWMSSVDGLMEIGVHARRSPGGGLVVPSLTSLAKLAAALDVTVADLVIGDSKRDRLYDLTRSMAEREVAVVLKKAEDLAGDRTAKK
jgi:hypothetical protein